MKLFYDQNLSFKLVSDLEKIFPNSVHVRKLGLDTADDSDIWDYAKKNNFTIVTKDSDYNDRILKYESPPRIIWIRSGNKKTDYIKELLSAHARELKVFSKQNIIGCYTLYGKPKRKK